MRSDGFLLDLLAHRTICDTCGPADTWIDIADLCPVGRTLAIRFAQAFAQAAPTSAAWN